MVMVRFARVWRAVLRMGHPLVRWSMQMMTQDGGKTTQFQGDHEGCRGFTTKFGGMCKKLLLPGLEFRCPETWCRRHQHGITFAHGDCATGTSLPEGAFRAGEA